jgi:DNA-binding GntR family transcriptional regulator
MAKRSPPGGARRRSALESLNGWRNDQPCCQEHELYGRLLEDIVSGRYEVGDRLPAENDFALSFAVSRPVVREALTRLAADGLVSARQGAGTFIARVPPRQIVKLVPRASIAGILRVFEVRIALEGQAARLAAGRRSAAELARSAARWKPCAGHGGREPAFDPDSPFTAPWRWRPAI